MFLREPPMTHDTAFLAAIRENPEDDAVRLVYANWLEERGDAARAEFIRLQCESARLGADDPCRQEQIYADWLDDHGQILRALVIRRQCELARLGADDPCHQELARREGELLEEWRDVWLGEGRLALALAERWE